jgi:hypothetical protein
MYVFFSFFVIFFPQQNHIWRGLSSSHSQELSGRVPAAAVALTAVLLGVLFMDLSKATLRAMVDLGGVFVLLGVHISLLCGWVGVSVSLCVSLCACMCVCVCMCVCMCVCGKSHGRAPWCIYILGVYVCVNVCVWKVPWSFSIDRWIEGR